MVALVVSFVVVLGSASAALAGPVWSIGSLASTSVAPEGELVYDVQIGNAGDAVTLAGENTIVAKLPNGVTAVEAGLLKETEGEPSETKCTAGDGVSPVAGASEVKCTDTEQLEPPALAHRKRYQTMRLKVKLNSSVEGVFQSLFEVSGGGAASAQTAASSTVMVGLPEFGVYAFDSRLLDGAGNTVTQAGAHPADQAVSLDFNTYTSPVPVEGIGWPVRPVKDVLVDLPAGMVGDPTVVGRCTSIQLANSASLESKPLCPSNSQVGTITLRVGNYPFDPDLFGPLPIFNMVAPPNAPAEFGFNFAGTVVVLDARVRSNGDYGISVDSKNISEALGIAGVSTTFWGVPYDKSHDLERACPGEQAPFFGGKTCTVTGVPQQAFLRMPTSCTLPGESVSTAVHVDSWFEPGVYQSSAVASHRAPGYPLQSSEWGAPVGVEGCDQVPFTPSTLPQPTSHAPDTATGLNLTLSLPQNEDPSKIAESDLHKIAIVFPEGMTINPAAAANGLQACTEAQIGLSTSNPAACPDASKLGKVEVESPALEKPLKGGLYLASQDANPFHSLLATYMVVEGSGVVLKLAGEMHADPTTGRLSTSFEKVPQLPFSKTTVEVFGGTGAPLIAPAACGSKPFSTQMTGWSGKEVAITSPYVVQCVPGMGGFAPSFTAGSVNPTAGAFSPFVLSFGRNDGEQQIVGVTDTLPPGVSAVLKGVPRCPDAQAAAGTCPASSRIGSVTAASGAGAEQVYLKGTIYLTGPYNGGPFGESIVVPAVAGPFNLGNVVVRGSIRIDPKTAQPTVVSDPVPRFVGTTGIPTDVRRIDVTLDRPGFTFNPTDCNELKATATLTGSAGAVANLSSRFAAAECRSLAFKPGFRVTTVAKTSRAQGAALHVTVTSGAGQANIHAVRVSLPKVLPSRLTTLQKACADRVFEVNPALCPRESRVGTASAVTPLLASRLEGPVYFVSHGGAKFPELTIVLQGEGVTVMLSGETFINEKTNVTTSTFRAVPDTPVTRFDLSLPQGRFSALAATANLCKRKLIMPTRIVGQNGAVRTQSTRIAVAGCRAHKAPRKRKGKRR